MRDPKPNPWPGSPNAYECPWGCNGTGTMPWFAHVAGGVCFSCRGEGWILGRGQARPSPRRPAAAAAPGASRWQLIGGRIVRR